MLHEKYTHTIRSEMEKYKDNSNVEAFVLKYKHFYGSYNYIGASFRWYRREIRIIRNIDNLYSYKDAQGFRKDTELKIPAKEIDAYIYHYGWVRPPKIMADKQKNFANLYSKNDMDIEEWNYHEIKALYPFKEEHPKVMKERINNTNWKFKYDTSKNSFNLKDKFKIFVCKLTGYLIGEFKNFKIIK